MSERKEVREKMNQALKKILAPKLRSSGFKGSYPHFRRFHQKLLQKY